MPPQQIVDDCVNWDTKSDFSSGKKVLQGVVIIKLTVGFLFQLVEKGNL